MKNIERFIADGLSEEEILEKQSKHCEAQVGCPEKSCLICYTKYLFQEEPKALRYTIAIDFDGTLCENEYPAIGVPRMGVINAAKRRQEEGCALILWTCREGKHLENALRWLGSKGLTFDAVNENLPERLELYGNDCRKIGADEYWDDRAVLPETVEEVE